MREDSALSSIATRLTKTSMAIEHIQLLRNKKAKWSKQYFQIMLGFKCGVLATSILGSSISYLYCAQLHALKQTTTAK